MSAVDVNDEHIEALLTAASDGVDFDGLRVECRDNGYLLVTPERRYEALEPATVRDAIRDHPRFVSNWYYWRRAVDVDPDGARYAYLRWLERADDVGVPSRYDALADGHTRSWGQLVVTVRIDDDGQRRYELRHEADAGVDLDDLTVYEDPLDAREVATFDTDGRYRPLKTAPTLVTGWAFAPLDGHDLVRTVDFFYPATIANWHLERRGELDITHWRAAAERQTGIYDVVDELPPEAVAWAAEACCVDAQCLKRREWDLDEDVDLDVDRGEGEFPCREPCSLFIAAAREWAVLEREPTRTYEFELTPSEKAQLEALVDAVADGRVDGIREVDFNEAANRYRTRYLRAKRFADRGRLSGVPTDPDDDGDTS